MVSATQVRRNTTTIASTTGQSQHPLSAVHRNKEPASWHPKLTPYRLSIMSTTIAFGTGKAILTQHQSVAVPVTLEWLSGTLLSLLFFMVSSYDSREEVPSYLHWLFKPDCMDPVWRFLFAWFSIRRPNYTSEERPTAESVHRNRPLITPYRILVCATVVSVGMSKAMLGYYGFSADATWIDWALAVPLTSLLYCLGLYEYNSSHLWSTFFMSDQTIVFSLLTTVIIVALRFSAAAAWIVYWTYAFRKITHSPEWDMTTHRPADYKPTMKTFLEDMFDRSIKLIFQEFTLAAIVGGLVVSYTILGEILARGGMMRKVFRSVRRSIAHVVVKVLPTVSHSELWEDWHTSDLSTRRGNRFLSLFSYVQPAFRIVFHIALHIGGVVVSGTFTMLSLGLTPHVSVRSGGHDIICRSTPYVLPSFLVLAALGSISVQLRIGYSMLLPFLLWYLHSIPFDDALMAPRI